MTNQWEIALQKVLEIEHFPRLYLTIKVIETDSLSDSQVLILRKTKTSTATVTDKESNSKGERKRRREEMQEDELLWKKLKGKEEYTGVRDNSKGYNSGKKL